MFLLLDHFFGLLEKLQILLHSPYINDILFDFDAFFKGLLRESALHVKLPDAARPYLRLDLCIYGHLTILRLIRQLEIETVLFNFRQFLLFVFLLVEVHKGLPESLLFLLFDTLNLFKHFLPLIWLSSFTSLELGMI